MSITATCMATLYGLNTCAACGAQLLWRPVDGGLRYSASHIYRHASEYTEIASLSIDIADLRDDGGRAAAAAVCPRRPNAHVKEGPREEPKNARAYKGWFK